MFSGAEAQMSLRPPPDIVSVGIAKFAFVAIGRAEGEHDLVARADRLAVQRDVARGDALEALGRGVEAQRFLDRRRDQAGSATRRRRASG